MTVRHHRSKLLRTWMVASCVYVLAAIGFSVTPLQDAFKAAGRAPALAPATSSGSVRGASEASRMTLAKAVGKQALIVFAPPALVLWFGWDVWFAFTGFFPPRREAAKAGRDDAEDPALQPADENPLRRPGG